MINFYFCLWWFSHCFPTEKTGRQDFMHMIARISINKDKKGKVKGDLNLNKFEMFQTITLIPCGYYVRIANELVNIPFCIARFVRDIYYSKSGPESWVKNCPSSVNCKPWSILNQSWPTPIRLQIRITYSGLQIGLTDVDIGNLNSFDYD